MIELSLADHLLDFGKRLHSEQRAHEQLEGAVAIHNILCREQVAYLADEVGMGKTYVALGAAALFRHFDPQFRMLVIAPRRNIQVKWMKETRNFVVNNSRFPDLRVKGIHGQPVRELVLCENLLELVRETSVNPDRDFFCRLTSFSLAVSGDDAGRSEEARRFREEIQEVFPWLPREILDLRDKQAFKENVARAICCLLPVFDLVIVDEGHNLKHGISRQSAARNQVISRVFGRDDGAFNRSHFLNYGPRAEKVLFLSATPVEETYTHLWNQLDVFGRGQGFEELTQAEVNEEKKKELTRRFLVRRVTEMAVNGKPLTKNLYRREWRAGGVENHDGPIGVADDRQRLIVALVQKKVSELLQEQRFGNSFQIGMLASFESFLETAKLKRDDGDEGNFDDPDQTEDTFERVGIDVADLNMLSSSYRVTFDKEMPHPKMDAIVEELAKSWNTGRKALVFVRRVASVKELKRKLDERYNDWLIRRLRQQFEGHVPKREMRRFEVRVKWFDKERKEMLGRRGSLLGAESGGDGPDDRGATDTFFAWFLRGSATRKILDGTRVRDRYAMPQSPFFEDNYAAVVLDCEAGEVEQRLAQVVQLPAETLRQELRRRSCRFLRHTQKLRRGERFEAVQAAAIEWLKELAGPHQELAKAVWHERFEFQKQMKPVGDAPEIDDWLECRTFFTELRNRKNLRDRLWPASRDNSKAIVFREQELRARLLASSSRLGHAFVDLYTVTILRLNSFQLRTLDTADEASDGAVAQGIGDFLNLLEDQMSRPVQERGWGAFDELSEIAANFELILDVNLPDVRPLPLPEVGARLGRLLARQQPIGGMAGEVNPTLVGQFRMPGYPFVLISTDLLQEGEDLHTFCSSVHHYGISWTPSSVEQRIGRIDRVGSQTDRRLSGLSRDATPEEKLQVYYPYLQDTIEVVQVQRVLARMNTFLRLMCKGLILPGEKDCKVDLTRELATERRGVLPIEDDGLLKSAFGVQRERDLHGGRQALAVTPSVAEDVLRWFGQLPKEGLGSEVRWESMTQPKQLFGTALVGSRQQPFTLVLRSFSGRLIVHCVSPVGRVYLENGDASRYVASMETGLRMGALATESDRECLLTIEQDVPLPDDEAAWVARVAWVVRRVVGAADALEQKYLPGKDEPLAVFKADLDKVGAHES